MQNVFIIQSLGYDLDMIIHIIIRALFISTAGRSGFSDSRKLINEN